MLMQVVYTLTLCVKALVRWAAGKRLTNRLPTQTKPFITFPPWSITFCVRAALVRWAAGKRLTNRLPKLSLL